MSKTIIEQCNKIDIKVLTEMFKTLVALLEKRGVIDISDIVAITMRGHDIKEFQLKKREEIK